MAETGIVFAIDSDAVTCDLIRSTFANTGLAVRTCPSVDNFAGVNLSEGTSLPHCLLLDVDAGGGDGGWAMFLEKRVAEDPLGPVILMASKGTVRMAVTALKLGALDLLEKPVSSEQLREVVDEALKRSAALISSRQHQSAVRQRLSVLSPREREMLDAIVQGKSTKMVADLLQISARTVDHHRANLMDKMGAKNVADLVRMAVEADYRSVEATGNSP